MKRVACVLTLRHGAALAVSRPDPPLRFGLPGGCVEPGETYEQAARRELSEETGMHAPVLTRLYARRVDGAFVVTFYAPYVSGRIRSSEEGWARWTELRVLACSGAAFPRYTRGVFSAAGLTVPRCS